MPLFPLAEAVLLPHAIQPLHVFEDRYRQMVNDCLDHAGQIAMASYCHGNGKRSNGPDGRPELRDAVCIGQIVQHEALPDGRHNILLHGVCRARIVRLDPPCEERLYWRAELAPLEKDPEDQPEMPGVRTMLRGLLKGPRLSRMRSVDTVLEWFDRDDIPTHALLELIGFMLVKNSEVKYRLLAEPDPDARAQMIKRELHGLDLLVKQAERQSYEQWPKGMSWN
jgi:Lon protease-like protein